MAQDEAQAAAANRHPASNSKDVITYLARGCAVASLLVVGYWVHALGGVHAGKDVAADGSVSTDRLFNWHPVLMILAYAVFMGEAVLAYKAPWQTSYSRPQRKQLHWVLHSGALVCALLGFLAAWKSHTLKEPPIPNFYSPHSYIGLTSLVLLLGQYVIGFGSYLWPTIALERRVALGPLHRFWGLAVYATGMAAAAVGLQEKATFLQAFGKKAVYSGFIRLPAMTVLLLVATALLVILHFSAPPRRPAVQYTPVASVDEEGGAGGS